MMIDQVLKPIGCLVGIVLLNSLLGCGSQQSTNLSPKSKNSPPTSDAIFQQQRQLDKLYLTERTHKRVIRSGNVSVPFVDEDTGELCWPALVCVNPDCPGKGQDGAPSLFIHNDPLVKAGSDGVPVYPNIAPGQDYAQMVADAGGFPDAVCPACYEKFRRGKTETPEEKDRYAGFVTEHELRESAQQRGELERQTLALNIMRTNEGVLGDALITSPVNTTATPQPSTAEAGSEEEQRAVALAKQITRPLIKGGVQPETAELLRRVLKTSQDSQVRAAIIEGLGKARDPDSVPQFLDAMADDSPEMRKLAGTALERTCGFPRLFKPDAPLAERQEVIARYRKLWDSLLNTPGQPYIRMMKDPAFKEERGRRAMEKLKQYQGGPG
ncbi:MAG: HEAT repeat domain-containing protein [Planctomycetes bacterium]|nr:HEAT repeat domain-containing protein [Planctomycetota bacterium]